MSNYNDVLKGYRVPSQIRLDGSSGIQNEATLMDLGDSDNLAYTYYKGLLVYCKDEGTTYVWDEVTDGTIGLLPTNFTYPEYDPIDGIDYSNKEYNFILVSKATGPQDLQETLINGNVTTLDAIFTHEVYPNFITTISGEQGIHLKDTSSTLSTRIDNSGIHAENSSNNNIVELSAAGIDFNYLNLLQINPLSTNGVSNIYLPKTQGFGFDRTLLAEGDINIVDSTNTTVTGSGTLDDPFQITSVINGSETKINVTSGLTISGAGTVLNPYIISQVNLQRILTLANFTAGNYTLSNADNNYVLIIQNGTTDVTITVPDDLNPINAFFTGFTQEGTGTVTIIGAGSTFLKSASGFKIKGENYNACVERNGMTNIVHVHGNLKV